MHKLSIFLACLALSIVPAAGQPYPSRTIRIVVPYPPGGIADLAGRLVAEGLRREFNQTAIVENKAGANGTIGLREVTQSNPDGYTLMVGTLGMVINYAIDSTGAANAMKDIVPIASVAEHPNVMVINNKMPVSTVKEFVEYANANAGRVNYGTTGVGSTSYLATALLVKQTGLNMVHVPYKGGPLALNDLLGGTIDTIIEVYPVVMEQIRSGKIKPLAVTSSYRFPTLPSIPTFEEAGFPEVKLTGWLGLYGPPGLPDDIRHKLGAAVEEVMKQPATQEKFRMIGFQPTGVGVSAFTQSHNGELKRWSDFVSERGIRN